MDDHQHPWVSALLLVFVLTVAVMFAGGPAPVVGALVLFLVIPAVEFGTKALAPEARARLGRLLTVIGLPLTVLAAAIVVKVWPEMLAGRPLGIVGFAALAVIAAGYVAIGVYPAAVAHYLVVRARSVTDPASMWDLVEAVRRRRTVVRWVLIGCILALGGVCAALLALARDALYPEASDVWLVVATLALVLVVAAAAWLREIGLGSPTLRDVADAQVQAAARRAVEGVAIAAGIPAPRTRVAAHTSPTSFTVIEDGAPVVVFTSALLTLLTADELKAVAAHEIGHVTSDAITVAHTFDWMLDLLRILGPVALVLLLLGVRSDAVQMVSLFGAAILVGAFAGSTSSEWELRPAAVADAALVLTNPAMVLANLLSHVIGYALGQAEDLLADLRAVELTRHPEALHAALRRLRGVTPSSRPLPMAYQFRYFTAEGIVPEDLTPVQATIETRLAVLERVDPSLRAAAPIRVKAISCPDCGQPLAQGSLASHYDAPIPVDECPACGGIWFDALELYMAGTQALIAEGRPSAAASTSTPPQCPRCWCSLRRSAPYGTAADVWLHECTTCGGAWVRPPDLIKFAHCREHRTHRSAEAAKD